MNRLFLSILAILLVTGCAHISESPSRDYYLALGTWYDISKQFQAEYPNLEGKEKEIADKKVKPLLLEAKGILNMWRLHRDLELPVSGDIEEWREIKTKILKYAASKLEEK